MPLPIWTGMQPPPTYINDFLMRKALGYPVVVAGRFEQVLLSVPSRGKLVISLCLPRDGHRKGTVYGAGCAPRCRMEPGWSSI